MGRIGFTPNWIKLIMMCVTSAHYTILVNGIPTGKIILNRGIRQGDPISLYLFLICAEVLSSSSLKADREGLLEGVSTSKRGPRLNHLFFADDSLLFCRADIDHWSCLSNLPKSYEIALGKKLNTFKIAIFFSHNTPQEIRKKKKKKKILDESRISSSQRYDTYLGLSALVGKSRTKEFKSSIDKVWKCL
jgi:hypothetical protein